MNSSKRTRSGCWTCRKRKKKCDGTHPECETCLRLGLACEGYGTKIVWEDDATRKGMRRRGPSKSKHRRGTLCAEYSTLSTAALSPGAQSDCNNNEYLPILAFAASPTPLWDADPSIFSEAIEEIPREAHVEQTATSADFANGSWAVQCVPSISPLPSRLSSIQSFFMDNYVNNFSITYPSYVDSSNPFRSILLPLAYRNETVLNALLALSGTQASILGQFDLEAETLRTKGLALKGCRNMLERVQFSNYSTPKLLRSGSSLPKEVDTGREQLPAPGLEHDDTSATSNEDELMLLATMMILVLCDKVSGESCADVRPHLTFAHSLLQKMFSSKQNAPSSTHQFLHSLFRYNDILAAIAGSRPTLLQYSNEAANSPSRWNPVEGLADVANLRTPEDYFPMLLSRIVDNAASVCFQDIDRWDGNMSWLPSFAGTATNDGFLGSQGTFNFAEGQDTFNSSKPCDDSPIISEVYRNAAKIYLLKKQSVIDTSNDDFVNWDYSNYVAQTQTASELRQFTSLLVGHIRLLPENSPFESSLLWPIGIAANDILGESDRNYIQVRLAKLENRFRLKHYKKFRETLQKSWRQGNTCNNAFSPGPGVPVEEGFRDVLLLG